MMRVDIAIVGAGMAGAGVAAAIGELARVALIEAESFPGYHSTGRSAAFWSETYGGPAIQPLTSGSLEPLVEGGFLRPRGCLHIADADGESALAELQGQFAGSGVVLEPLDRDALAVRLPLLGAHWTSALSEPTCQDIDVAALHAHLLGSARRSGATLLTGSRVIALSRSGPLWRIETTGEAIEAHVVVNAAGAWASELARMAGAQPIVVRPLRRTMVQLAVDPPADADMPLVVDALGRFYFKPEAGGRLWLSPHDETAADPCDVQPEEIDIAIAIDRLERATRWRVVAKERAWAGLRSFAPDRAPIYGFDALAPGFFWCAGQGGFGIQTAPCASALAAALLLDRAPPPGIDVARYAPVRFSR